MLRPGDNLAMHICLPPKQRPLERVTKKEYGKVQETYATFGELQQWASQIAQAIDQEAGHPKGILSD